MPRCLRHLRAYRLALVADRWPLDDYGLEDEVVSFSSGHLIFERRAIKDTLVWRQHKTTLGLLTSTSTDDTPVVTAYGRRDTAPGVEMVRVDDDVPTPLDRRSILRRPWYRATQRDRGRRRARSEARAFRVFAERHWSYSSPGLCCRTQPLPSGSLKKAYAFQPLGSPVTAR